MVPPIFAIGLVAILLHGYVAVRNGHRDEQFASDGRALYASGGQANDDSTPNQLPSYDRIQLKRSRCLVVGALFCFLSNYNNPASCLLLSCIYTFA